MLLALAIAVALPRGVAAQPGSVQGIVFDEAEGRPLAGAVVALERSGVEVRSVGTDRNGLYLMGAVPLGEYILRVRYLGYAVHEQPIAVRSREGITVSVTLSLAPLLLEGVQVTSVSGSVERDLGGQRITPGVLRRIPTPAASGDLASYLTVLPGVVATSDRGGQLFVRGGTHTENMTLMDGVMVYQPFHILGFFSVFPESLISSVDFFAGGFGARYSGRTSSVMDVQMRDGDRTRYEVTGAVSPFLVEATVEGPIRRNEISWMASVRRSIIDRTSPSFLGTEEPLNFASDFVKISSTGESGGRCSAMFLRTADSGRLDVNARDSYVSWSNLAAGGKCTGIFGGIMRFVEVNAGYSAVENESVIRGNSRLVSNKKMLHLELNSTHLFRGHRIDTGYFVRQENMTYDLRELFRIEERSGGFVGVGGFFELTVPLGERGVFLPGIVGTLYPSMSAEPRLRVSWRPRRYPGGELTGALGVYRQDVVGISDQRDASSIFIVWKETPQGRPTTSTHLQVGWEQAHDQGVRWAAEGYFRRLKDVGVPLWGVAAEFTTDLGLANGKVFGLDLRAEYDRGPLYGFIGYGWSWTQYEFAQDPFLAWFGEPVQRYHPPHDRRHQVNALATFDVGGFNLSGRWQIASGLPYTRPIGFDESIDYRFGIPDVRRQFGETRMVVERPYLGRLPVVHRLDLAVERTFNLAFLDFRVQAGAINAYDRTNMFYYDIHTMSRVNQLPFVPYLSLMGSRR